MPTIDPPPVECTPTTHDKSCCFLSTSNLLFDATILLNQAYSACVSNNRELWSDAIRGLTNLIPRLKVPLGTTKTVDGSRANSILLLAPTQHVTMLMTASPSGELTSKSTVIVDGKKYLLEAAGLAGSSSIGDQSGQKTVTILNASDPLSLKSNTYKLDEGAQIIVTFGGTPITLQASGTFSISELEPKEDIGFVAVPTDFEITLIDEDIKTKLVIDKTIPENVVHVHKDGSGIIKAEFTASSSDEIADAVFSMRKSVWLEIPFQLTTNGIDFAAAGAVAGPALAPTNSPLIDCSNLPTPIAGGDACESPQNQPGGTPWTNEQIHFLYEFCATKQLLGCN